MIKLLVLDSIYSLELELSLKSTSSILKECLLHFSIPSFSGMSKTRLRVELLAFSFSHYGKTNPDGMIGYPV